eukprot:g873.t1
MSGRASLTAGQAGLYDAFDALAVQQKTGKLPEATLVSWVKDLSESKLGVFNKQMLELAFPDRESILRLEADIKSTSVESYYGSSLTVTFCHVLRTVQEAPAPTGWTEAGSTKPAGGTEAVRSLTMGAAGGGRLQLVAVAAALAQHQCHKCSDQYQPQQLFTAEGTKGCEENKILAKESIFFQWLHMATLRVPGGEDFEKNAGWTEHNQEAHRRYFTPDGETDDDAEAIYDSNYQALAAQWEKQATKQSQLSGAMHSHEFAVNHVLSVNPKASNIDIFRYMYCAVGGIGRLKSFATPHDIQLYVLFCYMCVLLHEYLFNSAEFFTSTERNYDLETLFNAKKRQLIGSDVHHTAESATMGVTNFIYDAFQFGLDDASKSSLANSTFLRKVKEIAMFEQLHQQLKVNCDGDGDSKQPQMLCAAGCDSKSMFLFNPRLLRKNLTGLRDVVVRHVNEIGELGMLAGNLHTDGHWKTFVARLLHNYCVVLVLTSSVAKDRHGRGGVGQHGCLLFMVVSDGESSLTAEKVGFYTWGMSMVVSNAEWFVYPTVLTSDANLGSAAGWGKWIQKLNFGQHLMCWFHVSQAIDDVIHKAFKKDETVLARSKQKQSAQNRQDWTAWRAKIRVLRRAQNSKQFVELAMALVTELLIEKRYHTFHRLSFYLQPPYFNFFKRSISQHRVFCVNTGNSLAESYMELLRLFLQGKRQTIQEFVLYVAPLMCQYLEKRQNWPVSRYPDFSVDDAQRESKEKAHQLLGESCSNVLYTTVAADAVIAPTGKVFLTFDETMLESTASYDDYQKPGAVAYFCQLLEDPAENAKQFCSKWLIQKACGEGDRSLLSWVAYDYVVNACSNGQEPNEVVFTWVKTDDIQPTEVDMLAGAPMISSALTAELQSVGTAKRTFTLPPGWFELDSYRAPGAETEVWVPELGRISKALDTTKSAEIDWVTQPSATYSYACARAMRYAHGQLKGHLEDRGFVRDGSGGWPCLTLSTHAGASRRLGRITTCVPASNGTNQMWTLEFKAEHGQPASTCEVSDEQLTDYLCTHPDQGEEYEQRLNALGQVAFDTDQSGEEVRIIPKFRGAGGESYNDCPRGSWENDDDLHMALWEQAPLFRKACYLILKAPENMKRKIEDTQLLNDQAKAYHVMQSGWGRPDIRRESVEFACGRYYPEHACSKHNYLPEVHRRLQHALEQTETGTITGGGVRILKSNAIKIFAKHAHGVMWVFHSQVQTKEYQISNWDQYILRHADRDIVLDHGAPLPLSNVNELLGNKRADSAFNKLYAPWCLIFGFRMQPGSGLLLKLDGRNRVCTHGSKCRQCKLKAVEPIGMVDYCKAAEIDAGDWELKGCMLNVDLRTNIDYFKMQAQKHGSLGWLERVEAVIPALKEAREPGALTAKNCLIFQEMRRFCSVKPGLYSGISRKDDPRCSRARDSAKSKGKERHKKRARRENKSEGYEEEEQEQEEEEEDEEEEGQEGQEEDQEEEEEEQEEEEESQEEEEQEAQE